MKLDFNQTYNSVAVQAQNIAGYGVVFEMSYPGQGSSFRWTSASFGGSGALSGIDISGYDAFALDFTLLTVNGQTNYSNGGNTVIAGALINRQTATYAYQPQHLNFDYSPRVVSTTTTDSDIVTLIGFTVNIPYWWYDTNTSPWNLNGNTVKVLVQPAAGAYQIVPEPATLSLLALGGLALLRKRK